MRPLFTAIKGSLAGGPRRPVNGGAVHGRAVHGRPVRRGLSALVTSLLVLAGIPILAIGPEASTAMAYRRPITRTRTATHAVKGARSHKKKPAVRTRKLTTANSVPAKPTPIKSTPTKPAAPASSASPGMAVGVATYSTDEFAVIAAAGIRNVRMDRPSAGAVELARSYGIEVLPIVDYGFSDLSGNPDPYYPPLPQNRAAWAKRMVDIWRNMSKPPQVFEVWNEPWLARFWQPGPDAAGYLALVKAFAAEAWKVWPNAVILVSADDGEEAASFRGQLLAADTTRFLADPRIHPTTHNYIGPRTPGQTTEQPCRWDLLRYACAYADFKAHGNPNPTVWVTEFGWESDTSAAGYSFFGAVTEQQQATYTVEALNTFRRSGQVAAAYSFILTRDEPWNYNWLYPDNRPKPVVGAVKTYLAGLPASGG